MGQLSTILLTFSITSFNKKGGVKRAFTGFFYNVLSALMWKTFRFFYFAKDVAD